ncbi:MAG: tandem-95 repeat protein [Acidimicrobiia bacterium]|nr:tandem-95 repeat protein [Acidimicrobiia bacterium]
MIEDHEQRWERRVWAARLMRLVIFLVPVVAAVGAAIALSKTLPRPDTAGEIALWWAALIAGATVTLVVVDRLARKALPLALLMQLTMVFPDKAPGRLTVVRLSGSTQRLEERMSAARASGDEDLATAAQNILALAAALNAHDRMTRGHAERVRVFTELIAEELGLDDYARDRLRWASLLHDIGKLDVHADILNKPDPPTEAEWALLRQHPMHGAVLLGPLAGWLGEWAPAVEQHHEKYDGTGYPVGLAGEEISYAARIVAVADAYDAITSVRSYKAPIRAGVAREELAVSAGTHFDPAIIRAFLNVSLGKIRWVIGPASWFAQIPFIGGLERIGRDLAVLLAALALFLGVTSAGIIDLPTSGSIDATSTTVTGGSVDSPDPTSPPDTAPPPPATTTTTPLAAPTTTTSTPATTTTTVAATTTTSSSTTTSTTLTTSTTTLPPLRPPVAVDDVASTSEDTEVVVAVLLNDSDPDGDTLVVASADAESATGGKIACSTTLCTYLPPQDYFGTDSFSYVVSDGKGGLATGRVTVSVSPVNDPPVARGDIASTSANTAVTVFVLANDSDPEGEQRSIVGYDAVSSAGGTVVCTTSCVYTPPPGYVGTDTFGYVVSDPHGATASATVTISVN